MPVLSLQQTSCAPLMAVPGQTVVQAAGHSPVIIRSQAKFAPQSASPCVSARSQPPFGTSCPDVSLPIPVQVVNPAAPATSVATLEEPSTNAVQDVGPSPVNNPNLRSFAQRFVYPCASVPPVLPSGMKRSGAFPRVLAGLVSRRDVPKELPTRDAVKGMC